jgi:two-component system OmpR family response regulator
MIGPSGLFARKMRQRNGAVMTEHRRFGGRFVQDSCKCYIAAMAQNPLVLVVDDDPQIREVVGFALQKAGFGVAEARDGREALARFAESNPALIVLDILMPEMNGTDVCRELRARAKTPIIFLTSVDDEVDRILGLEIGGDDYMTKPFSPRELVARVRAVLRRANHAAAPPAEPSRRLECGALRLDLDRFQAFWDGREVVLTVTEFGVVRTLLERPGKVFTRDELMTRAYAEDNVVTDRTIDSHVRRVRQKFAAVGGQPIETVHGVGYKLGPCR